MEHLSFDRILELMTRNGYTCLDGNKIFISKDVLFFQLLKGRRNGFLEEKYVYNIKDKNCIICRRTTCTENNFLSFLI